MEYYIYFFIFWYLNWIDQTLTSNSANLIDVYACEGTSLTIECSPGEKISINRANYGRLNAAICNERRKTEGLNLRCFSSKAARIVADMCHGSLDRCTIPANNRYFGDPCNLTPKYLEVQYSCENASILNSQTTQPTRPIQKPLPSTTIRDIRYGENNDDGLNENIDYDRDKNDSFLTNQIILDFNLSDWRMTTNMKKVEDNDSSDSNSENRDDKEETEISIKNGCPSIIMEQIIWPFTTNNTAYMPCPQNTKYMASWRCDLLSHKWIGKPDLTLCNQFYEFIINEIKAIKSNYKLSKLETLLSMLNLHLTSFSNSSTADLYSILDAASLLVDNEISKNGPVALRILNEGLFSILDGLMNDVLLDSFLLNISSTHNNLSLLMFVKYIFVMEAAMFQMANSMSGPSIYHFQKKNILFELHILNSTSINENVIFPNSDNANSELHTLALNNHILISKENIKDYANNGSTRLVFALHRNLHKLLDDSSYESVNISPGNAKNYSLNSIIISASISEPFISHHLNYDLTITFFHIIPNLQNDIVCVFLNGTIFMTTGCKLLSTNTTHSICSCNHLTSFALLMSVTENQNSLINGTNGFILALLTYLGCVISIISLIISFLIFHFIRSLQCDRNTIHKNLAICLCIAQIIFVTGIIPFGNKVICSVVAALLHYFFLCAFMWMFFEGVQIYSMIIEVFESTSRIIFFYILAYSIPAVIVISSAIINSEGYGTQQYCWLSYDKGFIWAFIGPVLFIIMLNSLIFVMAVCVMCRHSCNPINNSKYKEKSELYKIRWWMRGLITIIILLGLTWIFGLLYINDQTIVFAYLFTIFNTNQGLFIFIFYCILNEKVQKEIKRIFSKHSWFPHNAQLIQKTTSPTPRSSSSNPFNLNRLWFRKSKAQSISVEENQVLQKSRYDPLLINKGSDQGTDSGIIIHSSNSHIYSEPTFDDASAYLDPVRIKLDVDEEIFYGDDFTQMEGSVANTDYFDKYCQHKQLDIDKYILSKSIRSDDGPNV